MALEIKTTLRVLSKKHALSELVEVLGEPVKGFSIGDKFSKGRKSREHTYWSTDSSIIDEKKSLDDHLIEVLNFYDHKKPEIVKLRGDECEVNISCFLSSDNGQGGAALSSKLMHKLSDLNLDLIFDIYADCE